MRQSVLQEDVRCWNRHQRAEYGRRGEAETERARAREGRVDGLDESGVPPPAYVRVAERAYLGGERGGVGGKPPDYVERREG